MIVSMVQVSLIPDSWHKKAVRKVVEFGRMFELMLKLGQHVGETDLAVIGKPKE